MNKKYSPRVQRTREKILTCALEIFSEKGFQSTTIREIAKLARVNDLTVYRHFECKEKLFSEMITRQTLLSEMNRHIKECFSGNFEQDVKSIIYTFTLILQKEIHVIKLMLTESTRMDECKKFLASFARGILQELTNFFELYKTNGKVREDLDCYALATSLFGTIFSRTYAMIFYADFDLVGTYAEEDLLEGWTNLYTAGSAVLEYSH
ncbi:TetR/AcrR family transcriptional regulator [Aneurinibacillus terranovensis]|uniref:TetR/AcrR family transcriptional regulator n=1 Tax=Aneurinibacillus terranovensis TaxID=278991 RepID=UPI0003F6957A|nr:TetR/AcrR family transcriptional regulator [Aneurinibacillus terranovensis]